MVTQNQRLKFIQISCAYIVTYSSGNNRGCTSFGSAVVDELVVLASDVLLAMVELVVTFDGDRLGLDVGPKVGKRLGLVVGLEEGD